MKLPIIILNRKLCLALFAVGALLCLALELCGVAAATPRMLFGRTADFPVPDAAIVAAVYAAAAVVTGAMSKRSTVNAVIYGACLGQCQLLLPMILTVTLYRADSADVLWRSLCGMPLTACAAGAVFSVKKRLGHSGK